MTCPILRDGFILPLALLESIYGDELTKILNDKLVITHTPKYGPPVVAVLYRRVKYSGIVCIHVPRVWVYALTYVRDIVPPPKILYPARMNTVATMQFTGELDHNQTLVFNSVMRYHFSLDRIGRGCAAALLQLEAGRGKTFVAAALIGELKLRTLYIVTKIPLQQQAIREIKSVMPDWITVAGYSAGCTANIVVAVINTALKIPRKEASQFSFVIYDEVHTMYTKCRREIFRNTMTWVNLGMTATPDRDDGMDAIYKKELALGGDSPGCQKGMIVADSLAGYRKDDVLFDIRIMVMHYYGRDEHTQNLTGANDKLSPLLMQKQFVRDPDRMAMISDILSELVNWSENGKKHGIYVFCEERDQLDVVYEALSRHHDISAPELEKDAGKFTGKSKKKEVGRLMQEKRIYLTTYGYSSVGLSNNKMTVEIFVTSRRNNMTQIIARVLRRNGDPSIPRYIVDIVDERTALRHQYKTRKEDYDKRNGVTYIHRTVNVAG